MLDYTPATAALLYRWLEEREARGIRSRALFVNQDGRRITPDNIYRRLHLIGAGVGAKKWNPHSIRHRVGQGWVDAGANLELVRRKLRHRDISTTANFYANQDRSREKQATLKYSLVKPVEKRTELG